jgi:hypothetical protein
VAIAAEQGLMGLLVFLWLNLSICFTGFYFVKSEMNFLTNMGLSFFALILMFFLYGMANPLPRYTYIYFALGMLTGIKKIVSESKSINAGATFKVQSQIDGNDEHTPDFG